MVVRKLHVRGAYGIFAGMALGLLIAAAFFVFFTFIFVWIWNAVVPDIFGWKAINFWQALGILILSSILFGGHRVISVDGPLPPSVIVKSPA